MNAQTPQTETLSIAEQAARWFYAGRRNPDHQGLGAWLAESPQHVEEYLLVSAVYREFDALEPGPVDVQSILGAAHSNVMPLQAAGNTPGRAQARPRRRMALAAAGAAVVLAGILSFVAMSPREYSTETGEQTIFQLQDGSVAHLNTQSRIRVRFTDGRRSIRLVSGEALFEVARDSARPFEVSVDDAVIRAVGTQFNVYRRSSGTQVSVLEGAVKVGNDMSLLETGQQATVNADGAITERGPFDPSRIDAWRQRRLVFQGDPLSEVAEEFNRYNRTPRIQAIGAAAAGKRLMGIFDADDPEALILFLRQYEDLDVRAGPDEVTIRQRE